MFLLFLEMKDHWDLFPMNSFINFYNHHSIDFFENCADGESPDAFKLEIGCLFAFWIQNLRKNNDTDLRS